MCHKYVFNRKNINKGLPAHMRKLNSGYRRSYDNDHGLVPEELCTMAMDSSGKSYYKLNERLLSIIGHWPHQSMRTRQIHQTIIVVSLLTIIIPELIKLYEVWGDLEIIIECIPPLGLHAINITKWVNCVANAAKLKKIQVSMELDWKSRDEEKGFDILRKYAERGRILTIAYTCYMFISAALYICVPLIPFILDVVEPLDEPRPREFLFLAEYFVDQNHFFVPIFFHALVTNLISVTIVAAVDTMYGAYVHYACALFAELCDQLENDPTYNDMSLDIRKVDNYDHIIRCVKKQNEAVELCNLLESTYSMYFLFVTGANIVLMSFTGVQTVIKLEDPQLAIRYGSYTLGQIVHVFFGCWHGQLLIDHSLYINNAIYNSKWYTSSFRLRSALSIMMIRSANPCQLSAGTLFFISSETFSTIIKSAMSYFTVLRSLR